MAASAGGEGEGQHTRKSALLVLLWVAPYQQFSITRTILGSSIPPSQYSWCSLQVAAYKHFSTGRGSG
eukprot:542268-Rhodomonas_salina.1